MKSSKYYLRQIGLHSKSQRRKWEHRANKAKQRESSAGNKWVADWNGNEVRLIFVWNEFQVQPATLWLKRNAPHAEVRVSSCAALLRNAALAKGIKAIVYHF